jgi:hypothetical protein
MAADMRRPKLASSISPARAGPARIMAPRSAIQVFVLISLSLSNRDHRERTARTSLLATPVL